MSFVETHNKFIESQKLTIQTLAAVSAKMDAQMVNLAEENRKLKQKLAGITANYHNIMIKLQNSHQNTTDPILLTSILRESIGIWLDKDSLDNETDSGPDTSDGCHKSSL